MIPSPSTPAASTFLVIGYGNPLRSDDGVGQKTACAVEELGLDGVRTLACHQLTPELAEPISRAERVVFVDAAVGVAQGVRVREIEPADQPSFTTHFGDPRALLGLAKSVFGNCARAWWITIPVTRLDLGESLSPQASEGIEAAVTEIRRLWERQDSRQAIRVR